LGSGVILIALLASTAATTALPSANTIRNLKEIAGGNEHDFAAGWREQFAAVADHEAERHEVALVTHRRCPRARPRDKPAPAVAASTP
jgi:hypothetical protein